MNRKKERDWTELFAYTPATAVVPKAKKCTCGNGNCKHAKRIRCVCGCGGIAHGIENRRGMSPLDELLGLEKEVPQRSKLPLGDLALNLELSGRLEFP